MFRKLHRFGGIGLAAAVISMFVAPAAQAQSEQQALVAKAQTTLSNFVRDPEMTRSRRISAAPRRRSHRDSQSRSSGGWEDAPSCSFTKPPQTNGMGRRSIHWRRQASASRLASPRPKT
jgi:hypothetical protein